METGLSRLSMRNLHLAVLILSVLVSGCSNTSLDKYEGQALVVTHSPNPTDINESEYFPDKPYPYVWYYQTKLRNNSDRELKVIWFEGYFEYEGQWYGSNIMNSTLRGDTFMNRYGTYIDSPAQDEWIKPGEVRICEVNWHGNEKPDSNQVKWAYIAVDRYGNDYYAAAIIEALPIEVDNGGK